jgi:hypothetical protein
MNELKVGDKVRAKLNDACKQHDPDGESLGDHIVVDGKVGTVISVSGLARFQGHPYEVKFDQTFEDSDGNKWSIDDFAGTELELVTQAQSCQH